MGESEGLFLDKNMLCSKIADLHCCFEVFLFGGFYVCMGFLYFVGVAFVHVNVRSACWSQFSPPCGSWGQIQVFGLSSKCLYLPNHVPDPNFRSLVIQ